MIMRRLVALFVVTLCLTPVEGVLADAASAQTSSACFGRSPTAPWSAGDDTILGTPGPDELFGGPGNDTIEGGGGNDLICGSSGDDVALGGSGRDKLSGGKGADALLGQAGADIISGGPVLDLLGGGLGDDHLSGGTGLDFAYYFSARTGVHIDLDAGMARGEGRDLFSSIQGAIGLQYADVIDGSSRSDYVEGGGGRDDMTGGPGHDALLFVLANQGVTVNLSNSSAFGEGADSVHGFEKVYGSDYDDVLIGSDGPDYLNGGDGGNRLDGKAGLDVCLHGPKYLACESATVSQDPPPGTPPDASSARSLTAPTRSSIARPREVIPTIDSQVCDSTTGYGVVPCHTEVFDCESDVNAEVSYVYDYPQQLEIYPQAAATAVAVDNGTGAVFRPDRSGRTSGCGSPGRGLTSSGTTSIAGGSPSTGDTTLETKTGGSNSKMGNGSTNSSMWQAASAHECRTSPAPIGWGRRSGGVP
jgi:Ca2+-binding RTX toxin-like protein